MNLNSKNSEKTMDWQDHFYLEANSVNAIQGSIRHYAANGIPGADELYQVIYHLHNEVYILKDEILRLRRLTDND
jgi:hypothetical protein